MRHVIPKNVSNDGGIMGGAFKKRNAAEAAIYLLLCIFVFKALFFVPLLPRLIAFGVVALIPSAVMLVGIADQSLVEFLSTMIRYRRRKDIIPYLIQVENPEETPDTLVGRWEKKKEDKKRRKEEKKAQKQRVKEFDKLNKDSSKQQKKEKKRKRKRNTDIEEKKAKKEKKHGKRRKKRDS